ncbi:transposase [Sporosarcina sp. ZBG7A]|uniref:transposase n=1 Tax=Sporosarcina sp. ZBG7A TaxID=1582223 RepID=UPI00057A4938|nr:transposase [Sporosarcina sp. ZBG7A]
MTKRIDDKLKQHLIKLVVIDGKKQIEVSREMDVPVSTLRRWVSEHRKELEAELNGVEYVTPAERLKQQRALEKEIQELKEENEILKKAMHIFSKNPQ